MIDGQKPQGHASSGAAKRGFHEAVAAGGELPKLAPGDARRCAEMRGDALRRRAFGFQNVGRDPGKKRRHFFLPRGG